MPDLTSIPCRYSVGDTVSWVETLPDYEGGVVKYFLMGGDVFNQFQITGVADGDEFTFTLPTSKSAGDYGWQKKGTIDGVTTELCAPGHIVFDPNYSIEREPSAAAVRLAALNTAVAIIDANPMASASINGESYTFKDLATMQAEITRLEARVYAENQKYLARAGLAKNRNIGISFVQPGYARC